MNEDLELSPELPDDEALAAEHALGVLNAVDRATAELRMAREPGFAADVEAWRFRLAPMLDLIRPIAPSDDMWARIDRALPANDNAGLRFWRSATMGSLGLAAASLAAVAVLMLQKPVVVSPPALPQILNARLDTDKGQHLFVAAYDPQRQAVMISSLVPPGTDPGHVHQLWLIPADGKPRPLGFVPIGASIVIPVTAPMAGMADEKAALAISVEAPGGSHKAGPTGPVVAVGKFLKI